MHDWNRQAARVVPSERQLAWQKLEFYAFIHFGVNTFTNREWGTGAEDPAVFNPTALDARQWVRVCREAGMRGLILTCKHHDGFCLWPSAWTDHSVKSSPWRDGAGDVVAETAAACREAGLAFGVYLSPWDMHEPSYGDSPAYNEYFKRQLREVLTHYGPLFCVWFDGACGEGPNGKRQEYDWEEYYRLIRELQPGAVISVCGPDVRWCGNEAGHCRESEWSVVPAALRDTEKIAEASQQADDAAFRSRVNTRDQDLGSREKLAEVPVDELVWYPAEVNTSIRPGWFYHPEEDGQVRPLEELVPIYEKSVGGNACFLLNLPPDTRGVIHEHDAARLRELGRVLRRFEVNRTEGARATASGEWDAAHGADAVLRDDDTTYWCPPEGTERAGITLELPEPRGFDTVVLREHIRSGQRIERFSIEAEVDGAWRRLAGGTVVGYKKIATFAPVTARRLRVTVEESRWQPTLEFMGLYLRGGSHADA